MALLLTYSKTNIQKIDQKTKDTNYVKKNDGIEVWLNPNPRCVKTQATTAKYFSKNYKASVLCDNLKYSFYKGFIDFLYYI